jgi:voltage-gated potassium channel
VGYRWLEGWSWFYAFYGSVLTLTSSGYGEKHALSTAGRLFTIVLALGGIFILAAAATEILGTVLNGELREFWGTWRMGKRIAALRRHVIVCGYGRIGRHVCAELLSSGVPVVVIDRQEAPLVAARDAGAHPLLGDATADAILGRAGIDHAQALIAVVGTDAENVLCTMTARLLHPELPIVARAEDEATVSKLARAGATLTVSPHALAGGRIAQAVLRPAVFDLVVDSSGRGRPGLQLEEQLVHPGSPLDGKTVGQSGLRAGRGPILVAIRRRDGRLAFNPDDDAPVAAGDTVITLGSGAQPGPDRGDALVLSR